MKRSEDALGETTVTGRTSALPGPVVEGAGDPDARRTAAPARWVVPSAAGDASSPKRAIAVVEATVRPVRPVRPCRGRRTRPPVVRPVGMVGRQWSARPRSAHEASSKAASPSRWHRLARGAPGHWSRPGWRCPGRDQRSFSDLSEPVRTFHHVDAFASSRRDGASWRIARRVSARHTSRSVTHVSRYKAWRKQ